MAKTFLVSGKASKHKGILQMHKMKCSMSRWGSRLFISYGVLREFYLLSACPFEGWCFCSRCHQTSSSASPPFVPVVPRATVLVAHSGFADPRNQTGHPECTLHRPILHFLSLYNDSSLLSGFISTQTDTLLKLTIALVDRNVRVVNDFETINPGLLEKIPVVTFQGMLHWFLHVLRHFQSEISSVWW